MGAIFFCLLQSQSDLHLFLFQGGLINFEKRRKVRALPWQLHSRADLVQSQAASVTLGLIPLLFLLHVLQFWGRGFWSHGSHLLQEFEVIAQIKLLQSACNNYSFTQEDQFVEWFHSLERLSEAER